ncbi:hypothetical protein ABK040_016315 [Willaertia magna]
MQKTLNINAKRVTKYLTIKSLIAPNKVNIYKPIKHFNKSLPLLINTNQNYWFSINLSLRETLNNKSKDDLDVIKSANNTKFVNLNLLEYKSWTEEEVASVLCTKNANGGAGLSINKVKPLVKQGFAGTSLNNIAQSLKIEKNNKSATKSLLEKRKEIIMITHKYWPTISLDILDTIIFWVEQNLINPKDISLQVELQYFTRSFYFNQVPDSFSLPYQNNKDNIKYLAQILLENLKNKEGEPRYLTIPINNAYFGAGKTRLGWEFLRLWKEMLKDVGYRQELERIYGTESVRLLENSKLLYIDLRYYEFQTNDLNKIREDLEYDIYSASRGDPCFVVLDEIGAFAFEYVNKFGMKHSSSYNSYVIAQYEIMTAILSPINLNKNISLYVCGKGAMFDLTGTGFLPPCKFANIVNETLELKHIQNIIDHEKYNYLKEQLKEQNLLEFFINEVYRQTSRIPLFVSTIFMQFSYNTSMNQEDIQNRISEILETWIPEPIQSPFVVLQDNPLLINLYKQLLLIGILKIPIDINTRVNVRNLEEYFFGLSNILAFLDCAVLLNCYVEKVNNEKIILHFPPIILKRFTQKYNTFYLFDLSEIIQKYGIFIKKGIAFEQTTILYWYLRITLASYQHQTFGEAVPFFKDTYISDEPCYPIKVMNCGVKVMGKLPLKNKQNPGEYEKELVSKINQNIQSWKKVSKFLQRKTNVMITFLDESHSPDKLIKITTTLGEVFYISIQDKNKINFRFEELREEIEKMENMRRWKQSRITDIKEIDNKMDNDAKMLLVVMYSCDVDLEKKRYKDGEEVVNRDGSKFTLHTNSSLVIADKEDSAKFMGEANLRALCNLAVNNKIDNLINSLFKDV